MRKSRYFQVYEGNRLNSNLGLIASRRRAGVYLIKLNETIVYVGYSGTNLYRTFTRHFQGWNDNTQRRVTFHNRRTSGRITARIVLCNPAQAATLEKALILKHRPRLNSNKYDNYIMDYKEREALESYEHQPAYNLEAPF